MKKKIKWACDRKKIEFHFFLCEIFLQASKFVKQRLYQLFWCSIGDCFDGTRGRREWVLHTLSIRNATLHFTNSHRSELWEIVCVRRREQLFLLKMIESWKKHSELSHIYHVDLSVNGLRQLGDLVEMINLKSIDLSGNRIVPYFVILK